MQKPRLFECIWARLRNYTWVRFPRSCFPKTINGESRPDARGCLAQVESRLMSQAPGNGSLITPDTFLSRIFETGSDILDGSWRTLVRIISTWGVILRLLFQVFHHEYSAHSNSLTDTCTNRTSLIYFHDQPDLTLNSLLLLPPLKSNIFFPLLSPYEYLHTVTRPNFFSSSLISGVIFFQGMNVKRRQ